MICEQYSLAQSKARGFSVSCSWLTVAQLDTWKMIRKTLEAVGDRPNRLPAGDRTRVIQGREKIGENFVWLAILDDVAVSYTVTKDSFGTGCTVHLIQCGTVRLGANASDGDSIIWHPTDRAYVSPRDTK